MNATNPTSFGNTGFTAWDQHLMGYTTNWEVLVPEIAKSVELSSDFKSAVVTLRKGMKWSDGNKFSSDDICFGMKTLFRIRIYRICQDNLHLGE